MSFVLLTERFPLVASETKYKSKNCCSIQSIRPNGQLLGTHRQAQVFVITLNRRINVENDDDEDDNDDFIRRTFEYKHSIRSGSTQNLI